MRPSRPCALFFAAVLAVVLAGAALAANPKPISPTNGASVTVVPPAGFANGNAMLRWSIEYPDCPGPDSIHSSYPEVRLATGPWGAAFGGGGPFLGDGTFTATANMHPDNVPVKIEWRIFWACGATENFAGLQGRSEVMFFMLQPASSATTTTPCAGLSGKSRTRCLAKGKRDAQLKRCAAINAKKQRDACVKKARDAYAKAIKNA